MLFRYSIWFNALLACTLCGIIPILDDQNLGSLTSLTSAFKTWNMNVYSDQNAHYWNETGRDLEFKSSTGATTTALAYKMHLISFPGQVCLVRSGWYERCIAFVRQASHWGLLQPLCSAHVWLWFRERDMIDSPDGALQLFSYSVQCGSRSPCRSHRLWVCIRQCTH